MSGKIARSGFASNINPAGAKEAEHRKTAAEAPNTADVPPEDSKRKRGRPAGTKDTAQLLTRPKVDNIRRLRVYAAERGIGLSVVLDALIERYLDKLEL